ncbi:MAG: hypothetical protein ACFB0B_06245 [Thermonemataceae bacterium]
MRLRNNFLHGVVYTLFILLFAACSSDPQALIVQDWRLDKANMREAVEASWEEIETEETEEKTEERLNTLMEMMSETQLVFDTLGNYRFVSMGHSEAGKWKMDEEGTQLTFYPKNKRKYQLAIEKLDDDKLVIKSNHPDFPLFTFKKVEKKGS